MIKKNRNREKQDFANINLLGKCNANCYFCLGKDIQDELKGKNQLNTHFSNWENFEKFISLCKRNNIKKLYLTGQTADGLQYKYLEEIVDYLQERHDFIVGVRTNGILVEEKLTAIKKMKGEIGLSLHSLKDDVNKTIMQVPVLNWQKIIKMCGNNTRVSIVYNRHNKDEFYNLLEFLSKFDNIRYIQVRRISTDTREDFLMQDVLLYEKKLMEIRKKEKFIDTFYGAERYEIFGKEVCFWATVETEANSFNYFTDGVISDEYFIIEGYLNNRR